jgi:hypothetical protein
MMAAGISGTAAVMSSARGGLLRLRSRVLVGMRLSLPTDGRRAVWRTAVAAREDMAGWTCSGGHVSAREPKKQGCTAATLWVYPVAAGWKHSTVVARDDAAKTGWRVEASKDGG